ncbi:exonuclease SbcCD subunit D [Candidatus Woesearchaeota archaeon]|nr:MAG: exonuclease SbcCD subunit D [Candidatus Woesearchaeota archaeon]
MKFAHMADVHIGSWRDPKLKELSSIAFAKAVAVCLEKKVDFVLISGDLFNTALPPIDSLKLVVKELKKLQKKDIPVYAIAGSHDFSPSGKTMLDVLEEAGLLINVVKGSVHDGKLKLKFTEDASGAKITGILGKRGMLDRTFYENLIKENIEQEEGFKIFMFHTCLSEFKPKGYESMNSAPLSLLPKHCDYYAGGHVHYIFEKDEPDYGKIVYPGPLFPANFEELEELKTGGFYLYEDGKITYQPIVVKNVFCVDLDVSHKHSNDIYDLLMQKLEKKEFIDTIVLLRLHGKITGKTSDINFRDVFAYLYSKSAFFVMKNTNKLVSEDFEEVKVSQETPEEIEEKLIRENAGQLKVHFDEIAMAKKLLLLLNMEKHEGEKQYEFEERLKKETEELPD